MDFELKNHPAQARHFKTGEPLWDDLGNPVPLFPEQRALYFDGFLIAYIVPDGDGCKTLFIVPEERLTKAVVDAAIEYVNAEWLTVGVVHCIAEPVEVEEDEDDE